MNLELDTNTSGYTIRGYDQSSIRINDRRFTASLILTPTLLIEEWPPQAVAEITAEHLAQIIELAPEIVLLGTGSQLCFPEAEISGVFINAGIGFEVMDTAAACRSYLVLASEGRNVAVALII